MKIFARCFGVMALCWIVYFFVIYSVWAQEAAVSASLLFGGILSIVTAVIYGLFDELWIQHRQF